MLMVLPIVAAVADRVETLERAGALPARVRSFLSDLAVWLADEADDPKRAAHLRGRIDGFEPTLSRNPDWTTLLLASLAARLRDVIDLRQDLRALRGHLAAGTPPRAPLAFAYTARVRSIRHRDHGLAAFSAFGVFVGLLVCCAIWIATGWPDGSAAPMMGAVACCLFAAQDDPAPQILSFTNSALVGALGAGLYLFAVLPLATSFEMLALALAPALILCGLMMTQPRTAPMGMGAALNGATLLALQNGYSGDFAPFANGVIASVVGMWVGAVVTRLIRSVGAGWSARRLVRINRQSLAAAADGRGTGHGLELAALMLDRIGLIAPRLATLPAETSASVGDLLADVRVGINLVEVRRVRRRLTGPPRTAVDRALALAARQLRGRTGRPDSALLAALDDGLAAVADAAPAPERRAALIGLTGLRRGLFPNAPAYRAAPPRGTTGRWRHDGRDRPLRRVRAGPRALDGHRLRAQPAAPPSPVGDRLLPPRLAPAALRPRPLRRPARRRRDPRPPDPAMTALFSVLGRLLVTLGMVAAALIVGLGLWDYYMDAPWTRDGRVRADVVAVAPDVSGLVTEVLVEDNQVVRKGDVLFRIDPDRFRIGLRQAEAMVEGRKATAEQTAADYARYSKLSDAAVSQQKVEATKAADLSAQAAYEQALADRDLAKLNLERSAVRASVNGRITNMELRPGAYVTTGRGVMALIDRDTVRIEGYFEETKLPRIRVGAPVTVQLMGEDGVLTGRVASIAGGIGETGRSDATNLLANVNPTFSWVRLAQRIPVRITLDGGPADPRLVSGRTATVSIAPSAGGEALRWPWTAWREALAR